MCEILSRINSGSIDKELYMKYQKNDYELAKHYAFDVASHIQNKSTLSYENISYEVLGDAICISELQKNIIISIVCAYPIDIRLDKILSKQMGISRGQIKKMSDAGIISCTGMKDIGKAKVKNDMLIYINL